MNWNNGKEWAKFLKEQEKLRKKYLAEGMTEEQIKALYEYDLEEYHLRRREALHTQKFDFEPFDSEASDEGQNPLYKIFEDKLTTEIDLTSLSRFSWIEEIEDEQLCRALKLLSDDYLEILTELLVDKLSQREIARKHKVKESAMSRKIGRIKKIIKNFLK